MTSSQNGALVLRAQDGGNYYLAVISDASGASPNAVAIFRRVGGSYTQITGAPTVSFTRGTPHTVTFRVRGNTLQLDFDGNTILTVNDSSITTPGYAGFRAYQTPQEMNDITWKVR